MDLVGPLRAHAIPMPSSSYPLRRQEHALSNELTGDSKRMMQTYTCPNHYN